MRLLRPLRLLVPLVAVGGALVIFLAFGFLAYQGSTGGGGGRARPRVLRRGPAVDGPVRRPHDGGHRGHPQRRAAAERGDDRRRGAAEGHTAPGLADRAGHRHAGVDPAQHPLRRPRLARAVPATALAGLGHPGAGHRPGLRHHDLHRPVAAGAELGAAAGHGRRADRAAVGLPGRLREVGGAGGRPRLAARGRDGPRGLRTELGDAGRGRGARRDPVRARRGRQALRLGRDRTQHLRLLRAHAARVPGSRDRPAAGVVAAVQGGRPRARQAGPAGRPAVLRHRPERPRDHPPRDAVHG